MKRVVLGIVTMVAIAALCSLPPSNSDMAQAQDPATARPAGANPTGQQPPGATPAAGSMANATYEQQLSYAVGLNFGAGLQQDGIPIELPSLMAGISDALNKATPQLTDAQRQAVFVRLKQEMDKKEQARMGDNQQRGQAFLAENAKKEGIKTTDSGLQYRIVEAGDGATPKASDTVRCHYEGTLIDGTVFDSSYKRGQPAEFPVGGVIAGWTEALQMMKVGAKWEVFLPSEIAYGARGAGGAIGPNETLIFTIELLDIVN